MCRSDLHTEEDRWESMRKNVVHRGFIDLDKVYDRANREALWQVLRMYDVGDKLLGGIKSMYDDSLACVSKRGVKVSGLG